MHPTGPNLPGHPRCGPGKIYDHQSKRCVSVFAAKPSKRQSKHDLMWEPPKWANNTSP